MSKTRAELSNTDIAIVAGARQYPLNPPFHPPEIFPEYPYNDKQTDSTNAVYQMVRESFRGLGLDSENFGKATWNPLGELISRGQRVLIKPNFVLHFNAGGGALEAVITHPSVIRAVADYVAIALGGAGEIIIGDAPQMNCDLEKLFAQTGMDRLAEFLKVSSARLGVQVTTLDFRNEQVVYKRGIVWERLAKHAVESVPVVLGKASFMEAVDISKLYGADYNRSATVRAHLGHRHEYLIAKPVLESDVIISVPKLKVHRKVGTTLNIKNMVGINTDKNHLAHYRVGSTKTGGDEMANPAWDDRLERKLMDWVLGRNWRLGRFPFLLWRAVRKVLSKLQTSGAKPKFTYGNWHGNDTAWRMALDLNRVLLFADKNGKLQPAQQRKYFSVVDGIIGGDGEGPLHPEAFYSGVILAGFNPLAVDWVATRLMGFNPELIALYKNGVEQMREFVTDFALEKICVTSNREDWQNILESEEPVFTFRAAAGWQGKIEYYNQPVEAPEPAGASIILQ
jgi:uncharacterized protein (DUF362 family)